MLVGGQRWIWNRYLDVCPFIDMLLWMINDMCIEFKRHKIGKENLLTICFCLTDLMTIEIRIENWKLSTDLTIT